MSEWSNDDYPYLNPVADEATAISPAEFERIVDLVYEQRRHRQTTKTDPIPMVHTRSGE